MTVLSPKSARAQLKTLISTALGATATVKEFLPKDLTPDLPIVAVSTAAYAPERVIQTTRDYPMEFDVWIFRQRRDNTDAVLEAAEDAVDDLVAAVCEVVASNPVASGYWDDLALRGKVEYGYTVVSGIQYRTALLPLMAQTTMAD